MSGTPPLFFVQVDLIKAQRWNMAGEPPFSGNGQNGQALPHCGTRSSLRGAFDVLPVAELLVVDARTSAACPRQLSTKSTSQEEKGPLCRPVPWSLSLTRGSFFKFENSVS